MKTLDIIDRLAKKIAPAAPFPSFTPAHVFMIIEVIGSSGPIGRTKLSNILELGEGATRTLIKRLQKEGIIKSTKSGCVLTDFGKEIFFDLSSRVSEGLEIPPSPYTLGKFNIAILVKDAAKTIGYGIEQRDAAIKAGALGATTLIYTKDKFIIPGSPEDAFKSSPEIHKILMERLKPKEGDSIIIGSADDEKSAKLGAKAAALETLRKID
jgi:predicted transcriptional regulator